MSAPTASAQSPACRRQGLALRWLAGLLLGLAVLGLLLWLFPWDWLRGPVNRYVSERTGRHFAITRHLDVRLGRTSTVVLDGVEFANPDWARERWLLRAQGVEFQVRLWPLLQGQWVLPQVHLQRPELGLQVLPDGRRSWALDRQHPTQPARLQVGELRVDQGTLRYYAPGQRIDLLSQWALDAQSHASLPLSFRGGGQWRGQAFSAEGRTGGVLRFAQDRRGRFPLALQARAGQTRLRAEGHITHLAELAGLDMQVMLQGADLSQLSGLIGIALPASPAYRLQGQLHKQGSVWRLAQLQGQMGRSDVAGELRWQRRGGKPHLAGALQSRRLDLADLGPMIGLQPPPRARPAASKAHRPTRQGRLLPAKALDFARLHTLDADLSYAAERIVNAPRWPWESLRTEVHLRGGDLRLAPLQIGLAGGQLAGSLDIDARARPAALRVQLRAQGLQLGRLLPAVQTTRSSLGTLGGQVRLQGRGQSVAQWLGASSGELSLLAGPGRISNLLLEFLGLDGGEILKFLVRGDQNIRLRCAALAFDLRQGQMDSRVLLLDTVDTIVRGQGRIDLAHETLDLYLAPEPKDTSILSLRSPLRITGSFAAPEAGPDKGALAGRAGLAVALAAINPLLALAATLETGPGRDANCAAVLKKAAAPQGSPQAPPAR